MLTHPTLDQLRALRLDGMVQAFIELEAQQATRDLAHAEWLALLLDREAANRNTRRFQIRGRLEPDAGMSRAQSPCAAQASHSANVNSNRATAKGLEIMTLCCGPSLSL
jgi:hypothetical protein